MADSNADWGALVEHDSEMAEVWDSFHRLPDPGEHSILDAFVTSKHIDIPSLIRVGAKLTESGGNVLAFAYDAGIKYRDLVSGRRWSYLGSSWPHLKIIPGQLPSATVIVAEGETDGARLSMLYPDVDVAVMPGGALYFPDAYAAQLRHYELVLAGLDDDEAGNRGAAKITEALANAMRFAPPAGDWCEIDGSPPQLPSLADLPEAQSLIVWAKDLFEYKMPDVASYFEHALLPIGGALIWHGWTKGFKSFGSLDMLSALAQGSSWCGFENLEEPVKVAVMQYEIPPAYYIERVKLLHAAAEDPGLFEENFGTWTPLVRPRFRAGDTKEQERVLSELVAAGVQVFLLDPVRRAMGTNDMNAEQDARKLLGFFERLNDEGITTITVHHDNKDGARGGGGSPLDMSGSGAFAGDFDTIVSSYLPPKQDVNEPKRNLRFTLRNAPSIGDRSLEMTEAGVLVYRGEPFGEWSDDSPQSDDGPAI